MSGTWSVASRGRGRDHCPLREETTPVLQISSLSLKHQPLLLFKTSKNVSGKHDLNQTSGSKVLSSHSTCLPPVPARLVAMVPIRTEFVKCED